MYTMYELLLQHEQLDELLQELLHDDEDEDEELEYEMIALFLFAVILLYVSMNL